MRTHGRHSVAGQLRDRRGRWTSGAGKAASAAGTAVKKSYVPGSLKSESYVGTSADGKFKGVKVGGQFKVGGNRTVLAKGIVGISTKPAKVSLSKPTAAKATSATRSGAAGKKAGTGRVKPRNTRAGSSAGRKVGR